MKTLLKYTKKAVWVIMAMGWSLSWANNIQITNGPQITARDMAKQRAFVHFDLSWDNSWNTTRPNNYDAAWVFMKYRIDAGPFQHAYLVSDTVVKGNATSTPVEVKLGTSLLNGNKVNTGVFFCRTSGVGTTSLKEAGLVWDLNGTGVDASSVVSVRVFAIEMVYVPEGAFEIGDEASYNHLRGWGDTIFGMHVAPLVYGSPNNASTHPDNIIPLMTSNTAPEGYIASHAGTSRYNGFQAFNRTNGNTWDGGNIGANWSWVQLQFPAKVRPTWGIFKGNNTIQGFCVQGSNDGINWTRIHGDFVYNTGLTPYVFVSNVNVPIVFDEPGEYQYFRFNAITSSSYPGFYTIMLMEQGEERVNKIFSEDTKWYSLSANGAAATNWDTIPAAFPKGYKGFYVMKHEVTQAAWVDFLNTLTISQQSVRSHLVPSSTEGTKLFAHTRMFIKIRERASDMPAVFGCSNDGQNWNHETQGGNTPMFNLAWTDIASYLAWACLRPMTELEYEKACRGPELPVRGEFAWGTPYGTAVTSSVTYPNQANEAPIPAQSNHSSANAYSSTAWSSSQAFWPFRAGGYARPQSTRVEAGASYWGILNLTDNVPERVIIMDHIDGRNFTGEHGNGILLGDGNADISGWPATRAAMGQNNALANGTGYRGVDVSTTTIYAIRQVSYRGGTGGFYAGGNYNQNYRDQWTGCRGARTAE